MTEIDPSSPVSQRNLDGYVRGPVGMDAIQCADLARLRMKQFPGRELFMIRSDPEERASFDSIMDMMMMASTGGTKVTFETWLTESEFNDFKQIIFLLPGDICYSNDPKLKELIAFPKTDQRDEFLKWLLNLNLPPEQRMFSPNDRSSINHHIPEKSASNPLKVSL